MNFILFNAAVDTNGFHFMLFDFMNYGALLRIALDVDTRFFALHLFGLDLINARFGKY